MANRYTIGSGVSSDPTIWDGGVSVPGTGDRVLIQTGHTVTLAAGSTEWGDDSNSTISINGFSTTRSVTIRGTLKWPRNASATLTLNGGMRGETTSTFDMGSEIDPIPTAYTAKLLTNKSASPAAAKYEVRLMGYINMWGKVRKRIPTLTATVAVGATSIQVSDATGWEVGDEIFLPNTSTTNSRAEYRVIAAGYVSGDLTVPLTAATTYEHLVSAPVVNATSNVQVDAHDTAYTGVWWFWADAGSPENSWEIGHAQLQNAYHGYENYGYAFRTYSNYSSDPTPSTVKKVFGITTRNTAVDNYGGRIDMNQTVTLPLFEECAFLSRGNAQSSGALMAGTFHAKNCFFAGTIVVDRADGLIVTGGWSAQNGFAPGYASVSIPGRNALLDGVTFIGPCNGLPLYMSTGNYAQAQLTLRGCDINEAFARTTTNRGLVAIQSFGTRADVRFENCLINFTEVLSSVIANQSNLMIGSKIALSAPNNDTEDEREFYRDGSIVRDTTTVNRSVASAKITTTVANRAFSHTIEIPALSGVAYRVIGYVQYDATYYNSGTGFIAPTVTLDGAGSTPDTFTASSGVAGTWEKFDLSTSHALGYPSKLKLTITTASPNIAGAVYLSGVPMLPFVGKVRHYGFVFDETNPARVVDTLAQATEAAASAYNYGTITWGASSSIELGASCTFQQLYDWHQYQACLNVGSALALTGAGAAGSPVLFAKGNVTTDGFTLNGAGSISMDSPHVLHATIPWTYSYTGGVFSQDGSVPTFNGGTLTIGDTGVYTFNTGGDTTVSATPTAPGEYNLSSGAFNGTLTFNNPTAHAVTVQVPAGTSTATATPGVVTFSAPAVQRGIAFSGLVAGSTVIVYDNGTSGATSTTRFNVASSGTSETWDDATSGSLTVDYVVLHDDYIPIRVVGVTVTGATSGGVLAVPVTQVLDRAKQVSSGLSLGTTATANTATKRFGCTVASTLQNFYSYMKEQWRANADAGEQFSNIAFPIEATGPNSFTFRSGWEADGATTIDNWSRDGLRYLDTSGVRTAQWAAILSAGVPAGEQVRFQQTDGGTTVNAAATGDIDELIQIYGDATHGNFDYTGHLVCKVQAEGYDQVTVDVVGQYGTLEDYLYVIALAPTPNTVPTGNPALTTDPVITQGTYVEDGKTFSIKIVDGATPNSGSQIQQWLRYKFEQGGTFQGTDAFNWHDLVQQNGDRFKTVRGTIYGPATTKGVIVYKNDGVTVHPDFNLFTADNGTTYAPVIPLTLTVAADVSLVGAVVTVFDNDATPAGSYGTVIDSTTSCPGATFPVTVGAGNEVVIQIFKTGYVESVQTFTMPASDFTLTATLDADENAA